MLQERVLVEKLPQLLDEKLNSKYWLQKYL